MPTDDTTDEGAEQIPIWTLTLTPTPTLALALHLHLSPRSGAACSGYGRGFACLSGTYILDMHACTHARMDTCICTCTRMCMS